MFLVNKLTVLISAGILCWTAVSFGYSGGSGTQADPYRISSAGNWQELMNTSSDWDKYFIVTQNILFLSGGDLVPVGTDGQRFTGVMDGGGYYISGTTIVLPDQDYVGLFGCIGSEGQVKNLGSKITVSGREYVGGLAGRNFGTITDCYATGIVTGSSSDVGGLVGCNNGTITNSHATGAVTGAWYSVGGFVGINCGPITSCYATGSVMGAWDEVGGFVGTTGGPITSCYATGSVTGNHDDVGGLAGYLASGQISNSYAKGTVTGANAVGGLIGFNLAGGVRNCYATGFLAVSAMVTRGGLVCEGVTSNVKNSFFDIQTTGVTGSAGGGTGLYTASMYNLNTYLNANWDFVGEELNGTEGFWCMPVSAGQDGYPILRWQLGQQAIPANDEKIGAIPVIVGQSISSTTLGATGLDLTSHGHNDCLDVWYSFTAPRAGSFTVQVNSLTFDPTIGIFDASNREVVFNDDFFGRKSAVILKARESGQYYIRVAGHDAQTGSFTLTLTEGSIEAVMGDLNYDGAVNLVDLGIFAGNWMEGI